MLKKFLACTLVVISPLFLFAQTAIFPMVKEVEPQPLLAQAIRLNDALKYMGNSMSSNDEQRLLDLSSQPLNEETVLNIQQILDAYCLTLIKIDGNGNINTSLGNAPMRLYKNGWSSFLVKVINEAGTKDTITVSCPDAKETIHNPLRVAHFDYKKLKQQQDPSKYMEVQMFHARPLRPELTGLKLEYAVVQLYTNKSGSVNTSLHFNLKGVNETKSDENNTVRLSMKSGSTVKVKLRVTDTDGSPTMASFIIRNSGEPESGGFKGVYPLPANRSAIMDEYPDFFFQPQVYRADGEHVLLPPGKYTVSYSKGPESIVQTKDIIVPEGVDAYTESFTIKRWVNMASKKWYSADHHIHAAGCSHYELPDEGVPPVDMWRQVLGEDLSVASLLAWAPAWYTQKTFFTGKDNSLSTKKNILRNDVEVSGFPSNHAGHVVLLRLKEDDYPGAKLREDWPTWTYPILKWAKEQGSVVGYAHSGWGLGPITPTKDLPNYVIPKMDWIGANEYIATVTQNIIDFYSLGDTPAPWELNMWYHTLNSGFRPRAAGETDYPCITDERVGHARSYFHTPGKLTYDAFVEALQKGRNYVSDGKSHIIDFAVNSVEPGLKESELHLKGAQTVNITAKIAAYLNPEQTEDMAAMVKKPLTEQPYWHIERARIGNTREVGVELIVNGYPVDTVRIAADGEFKKVKLNYTVEKSSWIALRVLPSSHSNPVFVLVDNKPIRIKKSAEWCKQALLQCWKTKEPGIKEEEKAAAKELYKKAEDVYEDIISKSE